MAGLLWLSDEQWAVMEAFMSKNQPGPERNDDRQVISCILHVLTSGCRWRDCPAAYGPHTTIYNRFNSWSRRGFWRAMLTALAKSGWGGAWRQPSIAPTSRHTAWRMAATYGPPRPQVALDPLV
jgi:transposase